MEDKLPKVPNDPAHPLRPYTFSWVRSSHLDARDWFAYTYRDEFHLMTKIIREPRGRRTPSDDTKMGTFYRFDSNPLEDLDYSQMIEKMRERYGEYVGNVQNHPLVLEWRKGKEIEYTPSEPLYPPGSIVRHNYSDLDDEMQKDMYKRDDRRGNVIKGNALYLLVDWGGNMGERWQCARCLDLDTAEINTP